MRNILASMLKEWPELDALICGDVIGSPGLVRAQLFEVCVHFTGVTVLRQEQAAGRGQQILQGVGHEIINALKARAIGPECGFKHKTSSVNYRRPAAKRPPLLLSGNALPRGAHPSGCRA